MPRGSTGCAAIYCRFIAGSSETLVVSGMYTGSLRVLLKSRKGASTLRNCAFEMWPYVFILVSITGLAYEALVAWH